MNKIFTLYKIYYNDPPFLVYLGRTDQKLQQRLHNHFFKKPMLREIDLYSVSKIEYAKFKTQADMFLYEIYYINKYKPLLNRDDKAKDELTISLSEVNWEEFRMDSVLLSRWKEKLDISDNEYKAKKKAIVQWEMDKHNNRKDLSSEEYYDWLDNNPKPKL